MIIVHGTGEIAASRAGYGKQFIQLKLELRYPNLPKALRM
jgi:hypothetical protein